MLLETINKEWPILNLVLIMVDFLPIENLNLDIDHFIQSIQIHLCCHIMVPRSVSSDSHITINIFNQVLKWNYIVSRKTVCTGTSSCFARVRPCGSRRSIYSWDLLIWRSRSRNKSWYTYYLISILFLMLVLNTLSPCYALLRSYAILTLLNISQSSMYFFASSLKFGMCYHWCTLALVSSKLIVT